MDTAFLRYTSEIVDAKEVKRFLYLPQFTETLPKEMQRRRLALFTLTPNVLMFNPRRPKAVRNTIGDLQP